MINRKIAISIIALFAIITVVMGLFISKMEINVSSEFLLPEKSPSRENMSKMEDLFGSEKQIIIVIKTDGLFKEDNSLMIYNFLQQLPSIEGVVSYNSYQDAAKVSLIGGTNVEPYFVEGLPIENASEILNNPLYLDNLLNENGEVALIPINVTDSADVKGILELASDLLEGMEFYASGEPIVDEEFNSSILSLMVVYPPILFGLISFIYFLRLGSVRAAVIPSILSIIAALWTYGFGVMIGLDINILTSTVGLFIVIISSSYGLHFIDRYITNRRFLERNIALKRTVREELIPIFLSALTTAVGFLTFLISSLEAFRQLGIMVSLGIMMSSALVLIALPAALFFIDLPSVKRKLRFKSPTPEKAKKIDKVVLIVIIVFAIVSPFLISRIERNFDQFDYFKKNSSIVKSAETIREEFGWNMPFYVVLNKNSLFTAADATVISSLVAEINELEQVKGVSSIMDVSSAFNIPLPILQLAARSGDLPVQQYMVGNSLRLLVKTPNTDAVSSQQLEDNLKAILQNYPQYSPYIASPLLIISGVNNEILVSQVSTIVWALVVITLLLIVVFRSFKLAIVSVLPIALSVLFNFSYMSILGIKLEISTAIVAGVLLGMTIDYSIHLINRFIETKDIYRAREEVRPAILSNTMALAAGFASLLFAPLRLFTGLGLLLAIGMLTGAIVTLTVIPRIVSKWKKSAH
ncbi:MULTISPECIES: RND family transporter [unclassified Mesotoga]|uniref:efflux RND transporter permease subunit n=1 Tax=unclassified Mesotoga TaxID=1184398 RepID=UPI000DA6981E|nr:MULTISPECIES: MMPL family transporter [unclassified Mesotoga]PZC52415.1 RND transporter [Mesotoga sp. TolDC]